METTTIKTNIYSFYKNGEMTHSMHTSPEWNVQQRVYAAKCEGVDKPDRMTAEIDGKTIDSDNDASLSEELKQYQ